jgi:lipopolysaccharide/colanic/teichoic acid biosynthesis glycosyltransferase
MKHIFINIFKETFDKAIAIVVLIILSPLFIIISVLIKSDSRGPVFFVQERAGVKGKLFNSIKFRTMVHKAAERGLGLNIRAGDERITRIGRLLRSWSLDELPQLINV